jgi:hypothetical protein
MVHGKVREAHTRNLKNVIRQRNLTLNLGTSSFLGMVSFSSRFIPSFATMAEPLIAVTRQGTWAEKR